MRNLELETWVIGVAERVKAGQPVEDSRVELKGTWIDPQKAARRIAGHLNASRGEWALWVIGLDEKQGVVGANQNAFANWWSGVQSEFEGLAPNVQDLAVPFDGKTIVALLFESDRAPYVVKARGQIEYEVPWRDGTRVRSTRRQDLITLHEPVIARPSVEVQRSLLCRRGSNPEVWGIGVWLYIAPRNDDRLVIPFRKCSGGIKADGWREHFPFGWVHIHRGANSSTMSESNDELVVTGPGAAVFIGRGEKQQASPEKIPKIDAIVTLMPIGSASPIRLDLSLSRTTRVDPYTSTDFLEIVGTGDFSGMEIWTL